MRTRECVRCKKIFDCKGKEGDGACLNFEDRNGEQAQVKMVDVDFTKKVDSLRPKEDEHGRV